MLGTTEMASLTRRDGHIFDLFSLATGRQDEPATWNRPLERKDLKDSIKPIGDKEKESTTEPAEAEGLRLLKTGTFKNPRQPL